MRFKDNIIVIGAIGSSTYMAAVAKLREDHPGITIHEVDPDEVRRENIQEIADNMRPTLKKYELPTVPEYRELIAHTENKNYLTGNKLPRKKKR